MRRAVHSLVLFGLILALTMSGPLADAGGLSAQKAEASFSFPDQSPPQSVAISGPTSGNVNTPYTFLATVSPPTATLPIAYVWRATDQNPVSTVGGLTSTVTYTWTTPGPRAIVVTATNPVGAAAASHAINISAGIPPTQITWFIPTHGALNVPFWATAVVDPLSLTTPLTYTWKSDGQVVYTMVRQSVYDSAWYGNHGFSANWVSAAFTWSTAPVHVIELTAENAAGSVTGIRDVIMGMPPQLTLSGPGTGQVNVPYTFTVTAAPPTVTTPITYFWHATEQAFTHTSGGLTSTMTYTWTMPGKKAIQVWGGNIYGWDNAGALFQIPVPLPTLTPTLQSVAGGPWNSPTTWDLGRVPLVTDVVWIHANHTVTLSGPATVASLLNEGVLLGPTSGHLILTATGVLSNSGLIRAGDGAGLLAVPAGATPNWHPACNGTSGNPGANVIVSAGQTINSGTIQAGNGLNGGKGGDIFWAPSPFTILWNTSSGIIRAGDGGNGTPGGGGGPGGDVTLSAKPFDNDGLIQAGDGGNGDPCGGEGGAVNILAENTTNTGSILAGDGGDTTDNLATAHGGDGGDAQVWGKWFTWQGYLINLGNIAAGDGGNGNPGATVPQDAGCGGDLILMGMPNVFLSGGTHAAGSPGIPSADGRRCMVPSWVIIDPASISLAGEGTRVTGGNVLIYGGAGWELDLRGMADGAISATGSITLAVGPGGTIDLRHNVGRIFQAGDEVYIYADQILMDTGVPLWALAGTEVITGPGRILYGGSLLAPDLTEAAAGSVATVQVTLLNTGPTTDTFDLSANDTAGWPLSGLPSQVTVSGLDHVALAVQVSVPANTPVGSVDGITVQAISQADPDAVAEVETTVVVRSPFLVQIFLPLVLK